MAAEVNRLPENPLPDQAEPEPTTTHSSPQRGLGDGSRAEAAGICVSTQTAAVPAETARRRYSGNLEPAKASQLPGQILDRER